MGRFIRNQRGDTIVEVMIALAIISMVLASAYAITSRNVATTQDTQEHNQAQQLVQQQIERLRVLSAANQLSSPFKCIIGSGASLAPSADATACTLNADGTTGCTQEPCYRVVVTRNGATGIYEVALTWDGLGGETSSVKMVYGV